MIPKFTLPITLGFIFSSFLLLTSGCKKDKNEATPTVTAREIPSRNATGKSSPQGATFNAVVGDTILNPQSVVLRGDEQKKYDALTGVAASGGRLERNESYSSTKGWYVEKVVFNGNSETASNFIAYFFQKDGTYDLYEAATKTWSWGTWYVNKNLTYIVFDANTQYESIYKLKLASTERMVIEDEYSNLRGYQYVFNSFDFSYEDKGQYEITPNIQLLASQNWILTSSTLIRSDSTIELLEPCNSDDYYTFHDDGVFITNNGNNLCQGEVNYFYEEWWSFSENEKIFIYKDASTGDDYYFNVTSINQNEFILEYPLFDEGTQTMMLWKVRFEPVPIP